MKRSWLLGLSLIWALALVVPLAPAQRVVLGIDGDWWDSSGQRLAFASALKGQCVLGHGGSLQLVDSKSGARVFVYEKMAARCPSSCPAPPHEVPQPFHCADTEAEAPSVAEASLLGNSSHFIDMLLALLTRSPQLYMVAAARGLEDEPQESVLPLTDSEIDLTPAMKPVAAGMYAVTLEPLDLGTGKRLINKVSWAPVAPAKIKMPGITVGLYRLSIVMEGGDSEGTDTWVLLSTAAHYERDAKEFSQAVEITKKWDNRVDVNGKRALLRACLRSLAGDAEK